MSGAEGVCFDFTSLEANVITEFEQKNFEELLFEVALPYCAISFLIDAKENNSVKEFFEGYIEYVDKTGFDKKLMTGGILSKNRELKVSKEMLDFGAKIETRFNSVSLYLKNGNDEARNIAELLFELKSLVENSDTTILKNIQFVVEATDSFFVTITKMRALRWLLIQMYDLYQVDAKPYIHSITSQGTDQKSLEDENWNLIRNTTQAFSCILGGTNALSVVSHQNRDAESSKIWSNRIARNVSIMLREESFIDKNADPISGSYYCEQMSDKLIGSAWQKFQKMIK